MLETGMATRTQKMGPLPAVAGRMHSGEVVDGGEKSMFGGDGDVLGGKACARATQAWTGGGRAYGRF
jgi:hypothetical protein